MVPKDDSGLTGEKWEDCPRKPIAVATNHPNPNRRMVPLSYEGVPLGSAKEMLIEAIVSIYGSEIEEEDQRFIFACFRTALFHMPHAGVFYFDEEKKQIVCRIQSQKGFADFGVNKRWLQAVYARFIKRSEAYKKTGAAASDTGGVHK